MNTTDFDTNTTRDPDGAPPPPPQMPLGTGEVGADPSLDPLAGASSAKKLNGGLLLIIAVMVIAAGGLFFMRKIAAVTASMVIDRDVEQTIETFIESKQEGSSTTGGQLAPDYDKVLGVLTEAYSERQVPLRDIQRDPFIIFQPAVEPLEVSDGVDPSRQQEQLFLQRQAERRAQFEKAAANLRLKSILGGSNPLAIIDGKIVRVGDVLTVNDGPQELRYRIKRIDTASVDVVGEASELALTIPFTLNLRK